MTDRQQYAAVLVVDAARSAVSGIAPEELEVFDGVLANWQERAARVGRQRPVPGGSVGFGIDAALVSEVLLQAVAAAVSEILVLGVAGIAAEIRASWKPRRSRNGTAGAVEEQAVTGPAAEVEAGAGGSTAEAEGATEAGADRTGQPTTADRLGLTETQIVELRRACHRHALALGLSPESADLLADATVGAVVAPVVR
ncbi:hypothetical protein ACI2K4_24080 [Micromonospora sp. NPDC050397]|uniref:hypothetical protein n=1 Tax=Micromonospora sp. NPDC050397 TaxID=3364279 RepID=UPI00384E8349